MRGAGSYKTLGRNPVGSKGVQIIRLVAASLFLLSFVHYKTTELLGLSTVTLWLTHNQ